MMPGTGNKTNALGRVLLSAHDIAQASAALDEFKAGLGASGASGAGVPVVAFDTPKTILIPDYLLEDGVGQDYMRFNGMELSAAETVVASGPQDGIVALMAVHSSVAGLVAEFAAEFATRLAVGVTDVPTVTDGASVADGVCAPGVAGGAERPRGAGVSDMAGTGIKVRFTSPLLDIATGRKRDVNLLLTAENAYLAVWEKGLKMAEALPDNTADSLLYYMQVLGRRFKLRRFAINVSGEGAAEAGRVLSGYFSNVNVLG